MRRSFGKPQNARTSEPCPTSSIAANNFYRNSNEEQRGRSGILSLLAGGGASDATQEIVAKAGIPALVGTLEWLGAKHAELVASLLERRQAGKEMLELMTGRLVPVCVEAKDGDLRWRLVGNGVLDPAGDEVEPFYWISRFKQESFDLGSIEDLRIEPVVPRPPSRGAGPLPRHEGGRVEA